MEWAIKKKIDTLLVQVRKPSKYKDTSLSVDSVRKNVDCGWSKTTLAFNLSARSSYSQLISGLIPRSLAKVKLNHWGREEYYIMQ